MKRTQPDSPNTGREKVTPYVISRATSGSVVQCVLLRLRLVIVVSVAQFHWMFSNSDFTSAIEYFICRMIQNSNTSDGRLLHLRLTLAPHSCTLVLIKKFPRSFNADFHSDKQQVKESSEGNPSKKPLMDVSDTCRVYNSYSNN